MKLQVNVHHSTHNTSSLLIYAFLFIPIDSKNGSRFHHDKEIHENADNPRFAPVSKSMATVVTHLDEVMHQMEVFHSNNYQ